VMSCAVQGPSRVRSVTVCLLTFVNGEFAVYWFNARQGGALAAGTVKSVAGGAKVSVGQPPADPGADWLAVVRTIGGKGRGEWNKRK
jgi:hypothetical protein